MWWFTSPQIIFGEDALEKLEEIEGKRAFIVTDKNMKQFGFVDMIAGYLKSAGMEVDDFDEVESDPSTETMHKGVEKLRTFEPDWIIGLGGGSAMDAAKAMWVLYERPDLTLDIVTAFDPLGLRKKAKLITIPTTSGTGSEVTWSSIITDTQDHRKYFAFNREIVADMAFVDPILVQKLPPELTAATGADALTHAIEGFASPWKNDYSDALALHAIPMIFEYLPRAVANGDDLEAREKMHNAATMAGLSFGNSQAGIAHSIGHSLGSVLHIHHGKAVGLALPYCIEFLKEVHSKDYADIVERLGLDIPAGKTGAEVLSNAVREFLKSIGLPITLKEAGLTREVYDQHLQQLIDNAANDNCTVTSSRGPSSEEFRKIYECMFEGKVVDF